MYVHKYTIDEETVYLVSGKSSKPSKNITLTASDWKGYSSGSNVGNAVKFLRGLSFSKDEPVKKEEEPKKDKRAVSEVVRSIYTNLKKIPVKE